MKHTKEVFIKIYSLDSITDELIYKVLHKNFPATFIEMYSVKNITYRDVKK